MSDHQLPEKLPSASTRPTAEESSGTEPTASLPPRIDPGGSIIGAPEAVEYLTPEEQMARFEKELKENDWGHQPC